MQSVRKLKNNHNSAQFRKLKRFICERARVLYVDLDGCLGPDTEHVRAQAYAEMLNKYSKRHYSYEEASAFSGPPVDKTLEKFVEIFKQEGNENWETLKPSFKQLKSEHHEMYLSRIISENQRPNPKVVKAIKVADKKGIPSLIVSNGTDEGIVRLLAHWKLGQYFNNDMSIGAYKGGKILAYDSENMIDENGNRCRNRVNEKNELEPDKTKFMKFLMKKLGHSMTDLAALEDSIRKPGQGRRFLRLYFEWS